MGSKETAKSQVKEVKPQLFELNSSHIYVALGLYSCLGLGHLFDRFGGRESKACWGLGRVVALLDRVKRNSRRLDTSSNPAAELYFIPYIYDPR